MRDGVTLMQRHKCAQAPEPETSESGAFAMPPGGRMLVPETLDNLVSTAEAATECGVEAATVRQWVKRGHLRPADIDTSGRPLYRLIDVLRAARDTRQRAIGRRRTA